MIECEADVTPNQPWPEDGTALVVLGPSCNKTGERTLPLKHFPPEERIIINKNEYPLGLVVMPATKSPDNPTATLPCKISTEDSIILLSQDWPQGHVGWFTE